MFRLRPFWWWSADTRGAEVLSAVTAWSWGILLLLPARTFDLSPSYEIMAALLPEPCWGGIALAVGALQSLAMCGNVRLLRYPAALLSMILWTTAAAMFLVANPGTHAPVVYGILAAFQAWVIIRGPQEHG